MKVTFVYPDVYPEDPDWTGGFYSGIGSLAAALRNGGHQPSLIHIARYLHEDEFIQKIRSANPELIGFSSTSHQFPYLRQLAAWLVKADMRIPTIYGGIQPTVLPEESIAVEGIDIICRGEGEEALVELCNRIEKKDTISDIRNLWLKSNGNIQKNQIRPLVEDLDTLPFPDRTVFDYRNLMDEREGVAVFLASKGCPFSCTYCSNHLLRKIYGKGSKIVRFRSVDNVIAEIKEVVSDYPFIRTLIFHDDILFYKQAWAEEFADKYPREIGLPFICNARADVTDRDKVMLLKKAGCTHVKFGLESGNEEIRSNVLNRHMTNAQIKKAFALCKEAGIITLSFNMVGIPFETPAHILDTIKLNASIGVDLMQATIYQPYKGTVLAQRCLDHNFLKSNDLGVSFYSSSVLELDTLSPSQISMLKRYFKVLVRYYGLLQKLPGAGPLQAIRWSDRVLSSNATARALNGLYLPLNYVYKKLRTLKQKFNRDKSGGHRGIKKPRRCRSAGKP